MNFTIRAAVKSDAEQVAALEAEFAAYLRDLGDTTDSQFSAHAYRRDGFGLVPAFFGLVAQSNANLIGYLLYNFGYDVELAARTLTIIDLYVGEKYRRHGVGKALMTHAKQVCREIDIGELLWSVYKWNPSAHAFYKQLGAKDIADEDYMYLEVS